MRFTTLVGVGLAVALGRPRTPPRVRPQAPTQQPPAHARAAAGRQAAEASAPGRATPPQDQQPLPRIRHGINYVRVDAIVTDRQGNPVLDLKQDEFSIKEDGKPQSIESFASSRSIRSPSSSTPRRARSVRSSTSSARPSARTSASSSSSSTTTTCGAATTWWCVKPLIDFIQNQLAPADMVAIMYPLTPITGLTFTRNRASLISAIENFEGRRFDYRPRNEFEEKLRLLPGVNGRADPQPGRDVGAQGGGRSTRRAARRAQVGHLRERGIHHHPAAAVERAGGRDARHGREDGAERRLRTATGRSGRRPSTWSRT